MRKAFHGLTAVFLLVLSAQAAVPSLEESFARPPAGAKPWVYWFWSDGNLTREGITADLEAMQRVGIGGVLIMDVDQNVPSGPVSFMTPQWRELLAFATTEARRLGLQINLNNDAGWTGSGGPWIDAEHSMQKVVWSETRVSGPLRFDAALVQPETIEDFYRDIAVIAFPTPPSEAKTLKEFEVEVSTSANGAGLEGKRLVDGDRATGVALPLTAGDASSALVQLRFAEPFTARSLNVVLAPSVQQRVLCRLEASPDGRDFNPVAQLSPGSAPGVFAPVRAAHFRLVFTAPAGVAEPLHLNEIELSSVHRIDESVAKSGLGLIASPADVPATDADVALDRARLIDLTSHTQAGRLTWDVPAGEWTILRFGHTSTGKTNYPSPPAGKGLEVDKLSRAALDRHFDG
ncbi:MAG TPA: glycosyl hydrolase, partial [Candidatus Synoicihabitans sp.]|nr:glycosyl hydrolase [Candidatus Synoicihabitans sp.]